MKLPKLIILDRDGVLNVNSNDEGSPFYYILQNDHLLIKPMVREAMEILKVFGIPTVLATKQRCVAKGLINSYGIDIIHARLCRVLQFQFDEIYVEEAETTKAALYDMIIQDYRNINPSDIWLFDDSEGERAVAMRKFGFTTFDGTNLYQAITSAFNLK